MSAIAPNLDFDAIVAFLQDPTAEEPVIVEVTSKNLVNSGNFPYGYVTKDDQWTNYWREGLNSSLEWGWNSGNRTVYKYVDDNLTQVSINVPPTKNAQDEPISVSSGYGAASLGYEVTSTKAFAQCQVEKVYKFVCLRDPIDAQAGAINAIVTNMPADQYNMKNVFAKVAPLCMDAISP
jgi:hypothetical protein